MIRAKRRAAETDIAMLASALTLFEADTGRYPTTAEGLAALVQEPAGVKNWRGPYIQKMAHDPRGRPYVYRCPGLHNGSGFDLSSLGPDGQEGTADNVTNWPAPPRATTQNQPAAPAPLTGSGRAGS